MWCSFLMCSSNLIPTESNLSLMIEQIKQLFSLSSALLSSLSRISTKVSMIIPATMLVATKLIMRLQEKLNQKNESVAKTGPP